MERMGMGNRLEEDSALAEKESEVAVEGMYQLEVLDHNFQDNLPRIY